MSFFDPVYLLIRWWPRGSDSGGVSSGRHGSPASTSLINGTHRSDRGGRGLAGRGRHMVRIVPASGELSDYYHGRRLRLSERISSGTTLAEVGVAAHEAGHGLQHVAAFPWLTVRNLIVPAAGLVSSVCWIMFLALFLLDLTEFYVAAILLYTLSVIVQLVNVPIERDASRRAGEAPAWVWSARTKPAR